MKKRYLLFLAVVIYVLVTWYSATHDLPIANLLLKVISLAIWIAPMVIVAVIVYKVMERRRKN